MTAETILALIALTGNGLGAGVVLATVIGVVPWMLSESYRNYVSSVQFMWRRFDPLMPMLIGISLVADVFLVFFAEGISSRILFGISASSLAIMMSISIFKNVPINRYVTSLNPQRRPDGWDKNDPRKKWRKWNTSRALFAVMAFGVNSVASVFL